MTVYKIQCLILELTFALVLFPDFANDLYSINLLGDRLSPVFLRLTLKIYLCTKCYHFQVTFLGLTVSIWILLLQKSDFRQKLD